jgi:hypothetical protein
VKVFVLPIHLRFSRIAKKHEHRRAGTAGVPPARVQRNQFSCNNALNCNYCIMAPS